MLEPHANSNGVFILVFRANSSYRGFELLGAYGGDGLTKVELLFRASHVTDYSLILHFWYLEVTYQITKCDNVYYKVRQLYFITKCDKFITKCDSTNGL